MKNLTIQKAIKLGFDFSQFDEETTIEDITKNVIEFFSENLDRLKVENHFCEITQNGNSHNVNYGSYSSSGYIVDWSAYWHEKKQKIYHSNFLEIDEKTGEPICVKLWCWSK